VLKRLWILTALVCCSCASAPAPPSAPSTTPLAAEATLDVINFLVGDPSLWPRVGNHYSNQILDEARREVCWVKYANPQRFECWRWDDSYVYHAIDHALDGDISESYSFTDGRWLPRYLTGTWSLDAAANQEIWFAPSCQIDAGKSGAFPYRQRAWFEPGRDAGGDLGKRDTIVLEYAPYDPVSGRSVPEQFYFARGAGWYEWRREGIDLVFNRRGGPTVQMNRSVWCQAPL
jgi:hypothetical protein